MVDGVDFVTLMNQWKMEEINLYLGQMIIEPMKIAAVASQRFWSNQDPRSNQDSVGSDVTVLELR